MGAFRRTLKAVVLGLGIVVTVAMGAVFPVPPLIVLAARRRAERAELIRPASAGVRLDLSRPEVAAGLLDRSPETIG